MTTKDSSTTALAAAFADLTGAEAEGVWAAPGRVNLIGEHTDYNDGLVLPFALQHRTRVAGAVRADGVVRVRSLTTAETVECELAELRPGAVQGWGAYVAGVAWSLEKSGITVGGADLVVDTSVPQGSGLSSSAALECSIGLALTELYGHTVPALDMARVAQRAESEFVGMPCGLMDQMISMLGHERHAVLFDTRTQEPSLVPLNLPDTAIMVVDTRAPHRLVDGEYAKRRRQCHEAAAELGLRSLRELNDQQDLDLGRALGDLSQDVYRRRARHVVTENQRVLAAVGALAEANLVEAGQLLNASHHSLREDFEVTVPEVDLAQEVLAGSGAYGARITGGGFGGCVIALVPSAAVQPLITAVTAAYARAGFAPPSAFTATPAAGACRIR